MPSSRASYGRVVAALFLSGYLGLQQAEAQEACGLQDANFDTIFAYGFQPPSAGAGIGPPASTVQPPATGVTPSITITSPPDGAVLAAGKVQVTGTVSGPTGTGVSVAGVRAYTSNGVFATPEFSVDSTATSLAATATSLDGLSASASVNVSVSSLDPDATLRTSTPVGFSPLPVRFSLALKNGLVLQSIVVDFDGNGSVDYTGNSAGDLPPFTYPTPGVYVASATLTVAGQGAIVVRHRVVVVALTEQRNAICSAYAHLRVRLSAQDAAGAGQALMGELRSRLLPLFNALGNRMPSVAANLGTIADGVIGVDAADIIAVRDISGDVRGYPIHFARDAKGVWRIDSM